MSSHRTYKALLCASVLPAISFAATTKQGQINANETWSVSGSPYELAGDVIIAPQATLTIEPGVTIVAAGSDALGGNTSSSKVELIVQGSLQANGSATNPIVFRSQGGARDGWYGITLGVDAKASSLTNARIHDATIAIWGRSQVVHTLQDLVIVNVGQGVLWQASSALTLVGVEVSGALSRGVRVEDTGAGGVTATLSRLFVHTGSGLGVSIGPRVNGTVKRSRILMNQLGLEAESGAALSLQNCVVAGNRTGGVRVAQGATNAIQIVNNTIDRNTLFSNGSGYGLRVEAVSNAATFVVRNNLITNNSTGLQVIGATAPSHDTNDVWNNGANYTGTTAPPTATSINPLYSQPISKTLPPNATWERATYALSAPAPSGNYAHTYTTWEVPGAAFMRVTGLSWSRGTSASLTLADREGAQVVEYTSSVTNATSPAAFGNAMTADQYRGGYSAYPASATGYDFVSPAVWNYRLQPSSPVIDKANELGALNEDADGSARPYDGDVDGARKHDLGAYEFHENYPPTVNAGADRIAKPGDTLSFDGAGSADPDGRIVSWDWDWGDGSAHGTTPAATHAWAAVGVYTVKLTTTDDLGASASDTARIDVRNNLPPTADAGPERIDAAVGQAVSFDGGASRDSDGTIVSYAWNFGDGTPNGSGRTVSHAFARNGVFTVTLTVTDNQGSTGTDTAAIVVGTATANRAPNAVAGASQVIRLGQEVVLDGAGSSDPDGASDLASYAWAFGDGTAGATGASVRHTYASAGTFIATLTVTDKAGATDTATTAVTVQATSNKPPIANAGGPYTTLAGTALLFDGSKSSDPDGSVAAWHWDFGDGTTGDGEKVPHTYDRAGSFLVRLTVSDAAGATDDDAVLATISVQGNQPPVARAGGNRTARVAETLTFDAGGSTDPDGTIARWLWDFGDGATATTARATHAYASAGSYLVKVTVTDDDGASGQDIALVSVGGDVGANQAPIARPGSDIEATQGQRVVFNAAGSTDPDGQIIAFQWDFGDGSSGAGLSAAHAYDAAGTYTVTLVVIDDKGARGTASLIAVVNGLPMPDFGEDRSAEVGEELTFDASPSADDGEIVSWKWSFGDGTKEEGQVVTHAFARAGLFTVTLEVLDDKGAKATAKSKVSVTKAAEPDPIDPDPNTEEPREEGGCASALATAWGALGIAVVRRRRRSIT